MPTQFAPISVLPSTSMPLARFHQRIQEKIADYGAPPVLIAALGDSVTQGLGVTEFLHDDVYHAQLKRLLEHRYPQSIFSVVNVGDNGQNAVGGLARLERDVLHLQPDLLLIGYGLNDSAADEPGIGTYREAIAALVNRAREATQADIILLSPNMMPMYDNPQIPDNWRHVTQHFLHLQNDGTLAAYAETLRETAGELDVPVADVYMAWEELASRGVDTTAMLINGLNHPNAEGHSIAAKVVMDVIQRYELSH